MSKNYVNSCYGIDIRRIGDFVKNPMEYMNQLKEASSSTEDICGCEKITKITKKLYNVFNVKESLRNSKAILNLKQGQPIYRILRDSCGNYIVKSNKYVSDRTIQGLRKGIDKLKKYNDLLKEFKSMTTQNKLVFLNSDIDKSLIEQGFTEKQIIKFKRTTKNIYDDIINGVVRKPQKLPRKCSLIQGPNVGYRDYDQPIGPELPQQPYETSTEYDINAYPESYDRKSLPSGFAYNYGDEKKKANN